MCFPIGCELTAYRIGIEAELFESVAVGWSSFAAILRYIARHSGADARRQIEADRAVDPLDDRERIVRHVTEPDVDEASPASCAPYALGPREASRAVVSA